jgi:tetratricopeptide (TPR) repeat protein
MSTTHLEAYDSQVITNAAQHAIEPILPQFDKMIRAYILFNTAFLTAGFLEFILLIFFFTLLTQSAILASSLAVVFLTFFSYFILRIYYQSQKREQLQELCERYLRACKALIKYQEGIPEHHINLANACAKLSDNLQGREYQLYQPPRWLEKFAPFLQKFSCWCHWHDVHRMRELLLLHAVSENIKLVKCEPTSLEVHAALANAYIMLSGLYVDPRTGESVEERWMPDEDFIKGLEQKFRTTAERAIEEFKIINDFAPDDPWVHAQLAFSYHDLKMPLEEIKEYEIILKLNPDDTDTSFKLGALYFQQGFNAKGLRLYEEVKSSDLKKAEELIKYYGAYAPTFDT